MRSYKERKILQFLQIQICILLRVKQPFAKSHSNATRDRLLHLTEHILRPSPEGFTFAVTAAIPRERPLRYFLKPGSRSHTHDRANRRKPTINEVFRIGS